MKKEDLKKIILSGLAVGCLSVAQSAIADEGEKTLEEVLAVTENKTGADIFVAGCGGKNGCGHKTSPQSHDVYEDEQEYNQGQGQGSHTCSQRSKPYQGRA